MKVLFAVSSESISEAIVKKYQKDYKEILSYKNVYYFNAILKEIQKDKSYDRIVISEDLESFSNNNYDAIDKFIFEKLDDISDEAQDIDGNETSIILICTDRHTKGSSFLVKLFGIGIYNALLGGERSMEQVCKLINKPRVKKEAKMYYQIDSDEVNYANKSSEEVSELEIQNILTHFKKLGKNTGKFADSFNNIAGQYTDEQLKIIINCLPASVKLVLEDDCKKYQELMAIDGMVQKVNRGTQVNQDARKQSGIKIDIIENKINSNKMSGPIVIPSSVRTSKNKGPAPVRPMGNQLEVPKGSSENGQPRKVVKKVEDKGTQAVAEKITQRPPKAIDTPSAKPVQTTKIVQETNPVQTQKTVVEQKKPVEKQAPAQIQKEQVPPINLSKKPKNPNERIIIKDGKKVRVISKAEAEEKRGRGRPKKVETPPVKEELDNDIMLPGMNDDFEDDVMLPGMNETATTEMPEIENNFDDLLPGLDDSFEDDVLPGMDDDEDILPGIEEEATEEVVDEVVEEEEDVFIPGLDEEDSFEVEDDEEMLPGMEEEATEEVVDEVVEEEEDVFIPGLEEEDSFETEDDEEMLPGIEDETTEEVVDEVVEEEEDVFIPGLDEENSFEEFDEDDTLPGMIDEFDEDEMLPTFEDDFEEVSSDEEYEIVEEEEEIEDTLDATEEVIEEVEEVEEYTEEVALPGLDELDDFDNDMSSSANNSDEEILPGFDEEEDLLAGFDDDDEIPMVNQTNQIPPNNQTSEIEAIKPKVDYSMSSLNSLLTKDKKIVTFIGTSKNGTSFLINTLAALFSSLGINTAILDMTKNKNSYYIYTNNEEELRNIAYNSISKLQKGFAEGIKVGKNLSVYTALPNDGKDYSDAEPILSTLVQNHSLILVDCDFDTDTSYFASCQEIYLVQSMDILTIQPLTAFLRKLKTEGGLEPEKVRVVINKELKVKSLTAKAIIGGMSFYNDPSMSFMTELFNKDMVKACSIPFDENAYSKYLDSMVNCSVSINGYSKQFMNKLRTLGDMVYPLVSKSTYGKALPQTTYGKTNFSSNTNNTLNQMKKKY